MRRDTCICFVTDSFFAQSRPLVFQMYQGDRPFFNWMVCCPISDHVMILLRILPFKFSNRRVYINK